MKSVQCARCGRTIGPAEMEEGLVIEARDGYYCGDCVPYVHDKADWAADLAPRGASASPRHPPRRPEMQMTEEPTAETPPRERPEHPEPDAPDVAPTSRAAASDAEDDPILLMQRILDELKPISRAIMYEKTSIWNTLGGVAQIFALAVILFVLTEWTGKPLELLLLAVFLQLATLTFFLKGK